MSMSSGAAHRRDRRDRLITKTIKRFGALVCWYCGEPLNYALPYPDRLTPTIEHLIPKTRRGGNAPPNLVLAHYICNVTATDKLFCQKVQQRAEMGGLDLVPLPEPTTTSSG